MVNQLANVPKDFLETIVKVNTVLFCLHLYTLYILEDIGEHEKPIFDENRLFCTLTWPIYAFESLGIG